MNERAARLAMVPKRRQPSTSMLGANQEGLPALHEAEECSTVSFATNEDFGAGLTTFVRGTRVQLRDAQPRSARCTGTTT